MFLRDWYNYLKHWINGSHIIKTGLPRGRWYDKDYLIELGLFEIISSYISRDGEDAFSSVGWDWCEEHQQLKSEIIDILHFYHVELPERRKQYEDTLSYLYRNYNLADESTKRPDHEQKHKELNRLEQEINDRITFYLCEIVKMRDWLWT